MNYIIDTHIFLWLVFNQDKIASHKMKILENPLNNVYITSISFWEIALKYNLGKLDLSGVAPEELPNIAKSMDISIINIDENTMASFYKLSKIASHKDPFDRIIIWHCIANQYILVSQDKKFLEYKSLGLRCL